MKIILLDKIQKLGEIGDIVEVNSGYARNFLIPQKKAAFASKKNITEELKQRLEVKILVVQSVKLLSLLPRKVRYMVQLEQEKFLKRFLIMIYK